MAKFNSNFNYKTQVEGETVWERIKTLRGFLNGRERALAIQEQDRLEYEALHEEYTYLIESKAHSFELKRMEAKIGEQDSVRVQLKYDFNLCKGEIKDLKEIIDELMIEGEKTRVEGYTDEEMYEHNAEFEFATKISKEIQADILALGRPSQVHVRQAMSCDMGIQLLKSLPGFIPNDIMLLEGIFNKPEQLQIIDNTNNKK